MNSSKNLKTLGLVTGTLIATSFAFDSNASELFEVNQLGSGNEIRTNLTTDLVSNTINGAINFEAKCGEKGKAKEAKCGEKGKAKEQKCGEKGKAGEQKCGEKGKAGEQKCGEKGKAGEQKCGEKGKSSEQKCGEGEK